MCTVEVADGSTDSSLELDDGNVCLALLVCWDRLLVGNDLHGELVVLNNALDGLEVHPDVVGVEVLELVNAENNVSRCVRSRWQYANLRLELVDVLLGNLGNLEKTRLTLVVDDGTTLNIGLGLVSHLHDVLSLAVEHVLEDVHVDNSTEVVGVGEEDDLDTAVNELVKDTRVVQRLEHVTVSGRVPVGALRVERLGCR